jgi:hypothetical protein
VPRPECFYPTLGAGLVPVSTWGHGPVAAHRVSHKSRNPILSIAPRERSFSESVLNLILIRASVSKAWRTIRYFASVLTRVLCHCLPIRVAPISMRRFFESILKKRVGSHNPGRKAIRGQNRHERDCGQCLPGGTLVADVAGHVIASGEPV